MAQDRSQKTEKPTPKRKKESRRKGQVARTPELFPWLAVLIGTFLVPLAIGRVGAGVQASVAAIRETMADPSSQQLPRQLGGALGHMAVAVAPLFAGLVVLAFVVGAAQVGVRFSFHAIKPSLAKLNPVAGFKRLLSPRSLWETGKNLVKVAIIAAVAVPVAVDLVDSLARQGAVPLTDTVRVVADRSVDVVRRVAAAGLLVGVADFAYQRRRHVKDLMMTKQEVKDEARQAEGNPEVKAKIKGKMLAASRMRMLSAVKTADVVVVNPVHLAVALHYEPARGAPRVVALGKDHLAERIRQVAEDAGVPIVESIPLARALFAACDLGDEIPPALYEGVARLLVFVQRLGQRRPLGSTVHRLPDALVRVGDALKPS